MRIQDLFTLVLALIPLISCPSFGAETGDKCFDFASRIDRMVRPELAAKPSGSQGTLPNAKDTKEPSHEKDGIFWGVLTGDVHLPVRNVYFLLSDHNTTKNSKVDKMGVTEELDPHYLLRQKVHFEIDPFPLVTVEWDEQWAYTLLAGTPEKPTKILISYEKVDGTSHIKHLCGNILITQTDAQNSHLVFYEEAQATNQSQGDAVSGLKGKLKNLQTHAP
jgi:hypothetical protein